MNLIVKCLSAAAVIVGEMIEEWASGCSREDLLAIVDEQAIRIRQLEEELDEMTETAADIRIQNLELEQRLADATQATNDARGKDPNPYDPYGSCRNCNRQW